MSEPAPRRLSWWIGGALVVAVVAAIVFVVGARLRLNDDERFLLGRWELVDQEFSVAEFRPDGTFNQYFEGNPMHDPFAWTMHGDECYIDLEPSQSSNVERGWNRLIGATPRGHGMTLNVISENEIELDGTILRRIE